jgi:hypothetical protein
MPPQQGDGLLDLVGGAGNFRTHGGDIRRKSEKVKPLSQVHRTCSRASRAAAKVHRTGGL